MQPDQTDPQSTQPEVPSIPAPTPETTAPDTSQNPETPSSDTQAVPPSMSSGSDSSKKGKSKLWLILLVLVVLAVAAAAIIYSTKPAKQQTAAVKKDVPYLTYGFSDTGDITPDYPTESADTVNTILIDSQLFEGLVRYQDQTKVVPDLATSWSNPDDSTWVFNLRHNVKFHSGRTMTATDVKYSLDYAVAHQNDNQGATDLYLASTIKQIDVVSPYQVKITTNGTDPVLLNRLAELYIIDSKAKLGDPNGGTGPYVVKATTGKPSTTTLDLTATNNYWGGHVYTRAVHIQEEPTVDQLATDTASGKFDISGNYDATQLASIKAKVANYQPINVSDLGTHYLELNTEKASSPLHTLAARQAVTYALDIPAILKASGITGSQASQLIPPALPGYDPTIKNVPYNPTKAKELLAGIPNLTAPLNLYYPTGDESQIGEITKELDAVGFNVKATGVGDLGALVNQITTGQGDMFFLGYSSNTLDGLDIVSTVVAGTQNYSSADLTSLISQAGSIIDPSARIAILQKIEQLVAKDIPTVPLYSQTQTYLLTKPYTVAVDLPAIGAGTYFWQVYQK
jgi:peptide/nickel transport system substrate-binding protein